jgi:hypothetical protein
MFGVSNQGSMSTGFDVHFPDWSKHELTSLFGEVLADHRFMLLFGFLDKLMHLCAYFVWSETCFSHLRLQRY